MLVRLGAFQCLRDRGARLDQWIHKESLSVCKELTGEFAGALSTGCLAEGKWMGLVRVMDGLLPKALNRSSC